MNAGAGAFHIEVPRLGISVPGWRAAPAAIGGREAAWPVITVHQSLADRSIACVELADVIDRLRQPGCRGLIHLRLTEEALDCEAAAIDALLRTAAAEYPLLAVRSVTLDGAKAARVLAFERAIEGRGFEAILWRGEERFVRNWELREPVLEGEQSAWLSDGVVLITGGLGGIGRAMAAQLARRPGTRLALAGRSAPSAQAQAWLARLGGVGQYFQADIADRAATVALVHEVERRLGPIAVVLHAAGRLEDAWLANLTAEALERVLAPKVQGALNLDGALADRRSLGAFVLFASLAGVVGHAGQGAYAAANAWLDHFAQARERLRLKGERFGTTRSVAWPLWADGGMRPPAEAQVELAAAGLQALPTEAAMQAMARIIADREPGAAVLWGDPQRAARGLGLDAVGAAGVPPPAAPIEAMSLMPRLACIAEQLLKLPRGRLDPDRPLASYGFDSISLTRFAAAIRDQVGLSGLAPATFLDHPTLRALAGHLANGLGGPAAPVAPAVGAETTRDEVGRTKTSATAASNGTMPADRHLGAFALLERATGRAAPPPAINSPPEPVRAGKIAVVGIGCRFPGTEGAVEFWNSLCAGRRAISRVPHERWDWRAIDGDPSDAGNRTDCHFGGFIADIADFDAALFGLEDEEARNMDPQHRLVLEAAWAMLEDAGLAGDPQAGRRIGAFIGVQRQEYQTRLAGNGMGATVNTGNSHAMLVNRLSYLFGWTGPSLAIDTGCSSSGVAIHQAVRALQSGECTHAVAGGVNVVLASESVVVNRRMGLLTASDMVRPFDAAADGHLFADGAALVLLRPLEAALADGDFIYGVVAGSAANHNGEAMYLTAPSPKGQAEVIRAALTRAGVAADDIHYVEGQGAANTLVDGAELEAYRQVFGADGRAIPIGSLKGNLGHLESASGVASLIKVLLAIRTGMVPATAGHTALNWDAARGSAPCTVVTETQPWPDGGDRVRRAGVHNFGYGGANVHLVIEAPPSTPSSLADGEDVVVPFSAPSGERLRGAAAVLAAYLKNEEWRSLGFARVELADIAFTLQEGRRAMPVRAVVVASSVAQLVDQLERLARGESPAERLLPDHPASRWIDGEAVDWRAVRGPRRHGRIPLPGTPFVRRRFWPGEADTTGAAAAYYDTLAGNLPQLAPREEMNLLFAPLPTRIPGFSWLKTFFEPEQNPEHFQLFLERQRAMKARLLGRVDVGRVQRMMDIGCGFATDLIALAHEHPTLSGRGFTIAPAQAELAMQRVAAAGLGARVEVRAQDSARDHMGGPFDLMIGFEVTFHIADKEGLFGNIARNLSATGDLLLIDCVAETATGVSVPQIGQFTPSSGEFARLLAAHGLAIVHAEDASGGIANFLHDPDFERHLEELGSRVPALGSRAAEHRGWANFGKALETGLLRYVLLQIRRDGGEVSAIAARNRSALEGAAAYGAPRPSARCRIAIPASGTIEDRVALAAAMLLDAPVRDIRRQARFADLGITSLLGLQLVDALSRALGTPVRMTDLFDHPSIRALADHLATLEPRADPAPAVVVVPPRRAAASHAAPQTDQFPPRAQDVAVIGLAARFAGAEDIDALWRNLRGGIDCVGPLPASRCGLTAEATARDGGFLDGIELFDPMFFGITPREAEAIDPQQRLFLEQCWRAIENAGIAPSRLKGTACGVVAGVQPSEYGDLADPQAFDTHAAQLLLGNAASILASRIAYVLDLKGPAISVDTACSSSLVAVHQACRMLRGHEADLMLAGGVSLFLSDKPLRMMGRAGMLAPGGRCRPFSAEADGIAVGEGAAVVVLKRLADALCDGDRVWGVIRGSAVNQDGATNGITAPSRASQGRLAAAALADAELAAGAVDYIEAHGTGTPLGDPIELAALADTYGTQPIGAILLGSVKSNIGHASAAAGIAGLTKVLLALAHEAIPPTLHAATVNPHIRLEETPFRLANELQPWPPSAHRLRRAAVNSLGFAGTNCHVVVEEAPRRAASSETAGPLVFPLSARTDAALIAHAQRMADYLSGDGRGLDPAAVAATLQDGREPLAKRLAVIGDNVAAVAAALDAFAKGRDAGPMLVQGVVAGDGLEELVGGRAGAAFVQALMETRDLGRLARLWCRGVGVDWRSLRSGPRPVPVSLPAYPFDRVRCWVGAESVKAMGRVGLLVPGWGAALVAGESFPGRIALIGEGDWIGLGAALGCEVVAPAEAGGLIARLGEFDAVVDAGLDAALEVRHEVWRALAAATSGPRLLGVRPADEEGTAGAFAGGIAAVLGGEYARVWSRELQVSEMTAAAVAAAIRCELGSQDGVGRVLWRAGVRHVRTFAEIVDTAGRPDRLAGVGAGPVLITGGLGGLGLALARHLVSRGVRVLALAGLRPLEVGDGRHAAVEELRGSGAIVEIYAGALEDAGFADFVAGVRSRHGGMRGVVHAAGRVGTGSRAYVSRDFAQVWSVASPKIDGYAALMRALGADDPAFVVLYSSISAGVPWLAGGLVDYAAANAVLEAQARLAWSRGGRTVRAIAWGSWRESGLGAADADRLGALGLAGLSDAEGVALFERALMVDAPVVVATGLSGDARLSLWPLSRPVAGAVAQPAGSAVRPEGGMLSWLCGVFGRELKLPAGELDPDRGFEDYGVDSILLADLVVALERDLKVKLEPGLLLEHRTLRSLAGHLGGKHGAPGVPERIDAAAGRKSTTARAPLNAAASEPSAERRVAVIGLACNFPGAPDAARFWRNLVAGVDAIREVPAERWDVGRHYQAAGGGGRSISKWGGFIDDIALFDPEYFGIAAADAAYLDPLVRKVLEVSVQGLRDAGLRDGEVKGTRTGVFLGARMGDYGAGAAGRRKSALTGSAQNFIAAQVAHCLDLHGPNLVVDTACSSSLTAVHLAVRSLIDGESELAIAGGVDLLLDETPYIGLSAGQALSPRGRCRTFDESADGLVPGEGAGVVVLRRLDRALASGDRILAVIEGSAVNNDGRTMGLTTPNPDAQAAVIAAALDRSGADPLSVSYVEAHGTGTMIGDPIELRALCRAFGDGGARGRCGVGSVKSNIGHLLSAAGIASLIKVVLMIRRGTLVPTLHCAHPNPRFGFAGSPLRVVTAAESWTGVAGIRRAGVSSFGFGGTNVHAVVSDHGVPAAYQPAKSPLPPQEFNRRSFWIEKPQPVVTSIQVHPAALPLQEETVARGRRFTTLLRGDHPILRDHVVEGVGIMPGTMYFDFVYRALDAIDVSAPPGLVLRNIVFREPADGRAERTLGVTLSPRPDGAWNAEVSSIRRGHAIPDIHLEAIATREMPDPGPGIDVAALQAAAIATFDLEEAYALARKVGIRHGDFMKPCGTVWEGADFLLAEVAFGNEAMSATSCFSLHPALLDACCLVPFLFERNRAADVTRPFIPISIASFEVMGTLALGGFVLVRRTGTGGVVPDDIYCADIALFRSDGTPAARMTRLAAKRIRIPLGTTARTPDASYVSVAQNAPRLDAITLPALRDAPTTTLRSWLCEYVGSVLGREVGWDESEVGFYDLGLDSRQLLEAVGVLERGLGSTLYPTLLFEQGTMARLAEYLLAEQRAGVARLLASGTGSSADLVAAVPADTGEPAQTLFVAPVWSARELAGGASSGALLVGGAGHGVEAAAARWAGGLTAQIGAAGAVLFGWRGDADVAGVMELAGAVAADAALVVAHAGGAEGSGVAGLLASVSRERPSLRLVSVAGADADALMSELSGARRGFTAVRHRDGRREELGFGELVLRPAALPSGGTWVITGGLGGLGLIFARALVGSGARVGLIGRRAPDEQLAAELVGLGIAWALGDVSDRGSLSGALDKLRDRLGAFTGVIHAAGVLRDALVSGGIDAASVAAVLAPKVMGAANLDALTRHDPLEAFVVFSSVSGSFGNVGQAAYAYANGWLNGFAAERPGRTLSLGWPLWADGGMGVAGPELAELRERHGVVALPSAAGMAAFAAALNSAPAHLAVLHGEADRLRRGFGVAVPAVATPEIGMPGVLHQRPEHEPIAVIGLAGRYPGARDLAEFWRNLAAGVDSVTEVPASRWDHRAYFDASGEQAGTSWSRWGGFIEGVDQFDPLFFHISPREARVMDPQERLFLETSFAALEDAGLSRAAIAGGRVGVFAGVMWSQYQLYGLAAAQEGSGLLPMSFNASVANRVSHVLDLRGPSLSLDTACSSSLTALHLAIESLRRRECDAAFAGGVNLTLHPSKYQFLGQGRMLSRDGRCRAFGAGGDGYVPGEGVGVALLKRLSDAVADGDPIWGVLLGSGISHGGRTAGYTVPSASRQAELIERVLADAQVSAAEVSYIEAHGTGTALGDPIEVAGLKGAYGASSPQPWCSLGSVKSNIGHLESAAGIAGLTKVLLQLRHGQIAPSLHVAELNAGLEIAGTPFRVQDALAPWRNDAGRRVAGLSSFGAGGANAHIIIAEPPPRPTLAPSTAPEIIVLSARTPAALTQRARDLIAWIEARREREPRFDVAALAHTLQVGRTPFVHRLAFIAGEPAQVRAGLATHVAGNTPALDGPTPLRATAQRFLAGEDLDWAAMRALPHPRRIGSLPTYPFEHKSYWVDSWLDSAPPRAAIVAEAVATAAVAAPDHASCRALRKTWQPAPHLAPTPASWPPDGLIVLAAPASRAVAARFSGEVLPQFDGWDDGAAAARRVLAGGSEPVTVIDLVDLDPVRRDAGAIDLGRIAFLQTLIRRRPQQLRILHVTRSLIDAPAAEPTLRGAAMAGLVRMLGAEHPAILARTIDVDFDLGDVTAWIGVLANELADGDEPACEIRLRAGRRLRPQLQALPLDPSSDLRPSITPGQAYLVTGGTRGIGLALAQALVDAGADRLALMGRDALPPSERWDAILADAAADLQLKHKLAPLAALRRRGVKLSIHCGPLTDHAAVSGFLTQVRSGLGPIAGLIHAAGVVDASRPRFIDKTADDFRRIAEPKVAGLNALLAASADDPMRFVALCSSVAAAVPTMGVGMSDYAMANAYMDALAAHRAARGGDTLWLSLQWAGWSDTGMHTRFDPAIEQIVREGLGSVGLAFCNSSIGAGLFAGVLAQGIAGPVIPAPVIAENLDAALPRLLDLLPAPRARAAKPRSPTSSGATALDTLSDAEIDRLLAGFDPGPIGTGEAAASHDAWRDSICRVVADVLELADGEFGPDVAFRDVGIDSVAALRVVQRLEAEIALTIAPRMLIEHPTPRALAAAVAPLWREAAE